MSVSSLNDTTKASGAHSLRRKPGQRGAASASHYRLGRGGAEMDVRTEQLRHWLQPECQPAVAAILKRWV